MKEDTREKLFYYCNNLGDSGVFAEKDVAKAICTAWNIEADIYLVTGSENGLNSENVYDRSELIFSPMEDNRFNSELLEKFGLKIIDREGYRDIVDIETGKSRKYDWSEVMRLI